MSQAVHLVSVPHTGTKFTEELMVGMGFPRKHTHLSVDVPFEPAERGEKVVVPMRDPMLSVISSVNRGEGQLKQVQLFDKLVSWSERTNVHFFRVDCPEGERRTRLEALAGFCGRPTPRTRWRAVNTSEDRLGLKAAYSKGIIAPELLVPALQLRRRHALVELLRRLGYELLPWEMVCWRCGGPTKVQHEACAKCSRKIEGAFSGQR